MTQLLPSDMRTVVALLAALLAFAVTAFAPQVLNDGDTFMHIAAGQRMIADHAILFTDPFSYTAAGAPWSAHEWLAEILMALSFGAGGWSGLLLMFATAAAIAAGVLSWSLGRWLPPTAQAMATILALACMSWSLLARPHLLALPLLAIWVAGLVDARSRNVAPSYWLLPIMTLWVNIHGSFLLGLGLAAALGLEALMDSGPKWRPVLLGWLFFGAGSLAAALANPHLIAGVLFPLSLMGTSSLSRVGEWQAMDLSQFQPAIAALAVLLYVVLTRGIRMSPIRTILLLGLVYMALQHQRHQIVAATAIPLLAAEPLEAAFDARTRPFKYQRFALAGIVAALAVLVAIRLALPLARSNSPVAPIAALQRVPAAIRGMPVLNDYSFGGYLIFAGVRPFIDSRVELYGDAALRRYAALSSADRAALDSVLGRYRIRWSILSPSSPMVAELDALPGWHRIYSGPFAVVHIRDSSAR